MWLVKQVRGDLTFSVLCKSTYYKKCGNASVVFTRDVQRTKCIIVYHSKNVLTPRHVDRISIVCFEFIWMNYHCLFCICILYKGKTDKQTVIIHSAGEVGDLYKVKGIFNKEGYHSILQRHAIPGGQRLIGGNFLLQQDNDPTHTSKLCKNYLGKKQSAGILSVMEWPAQSPDLNPIELLWEQLDRMVHKKCTSSQSNLWEVLLEVWGEISSDYLNKLTARMPKVCRAVIAANGELFD